MYPPLRSPPQSPTCTHTGLWQALCWDPQAVWRGGWANASASNAGHFLSGSQQK